MAQFDYNAYQAQQAAKKAASSSTSKEDRPKTHFVNEFIKNDGDTVVVRFPYSSMNDIMFESTHLVNFPGDKFKKRVRCTGEGCPLCAEKVKIDTRVFVKAVVYTTDEKGNVVLVPAIWDRPAAFADIDLKNLMEEYGDLRECLFKIKRNGSALDTRYTMSIVTNKTVYNPEVYKADFSILDGIDASKVLSRPMESYLKALNPEETDASTEPSVEEEPVSSEISVQPETVNPAPVTQTATSEAVRPQRYKF